MEVVSYGGPHCKTDDLQMCRKCRKVGGDFIQCKECFEWLHRRCVSLVPSLVKKIEIFYCKRCATRKNKQNVWRRIEPEGAKARDKMENYFFIDEIVDHRFDRRGKREFLVKWEGFELDRKRHWEPEIHLDGAINALQSYLREHKLPYSKIQGIVGNDISASSCNRSNWLTLDQIISKVERFRKLKQYQAEIEVKQYAYRSGRDEILLLEYLFHCYVILFVNGKGYIADGLNTFIKKKHTKRELTRLIGFKLIEVEFNQQNLNDHCGSSAVMITLGFMKMYKNQTFTNEVKVPKYIKNLTTKMHKNKSSSSNNEKASIVNFKTLKCDKCGKRMKSKKENALQLHNRICSS